jgi:hypothetical protein
MVAPRAAAAPKRWASYDLSRMSHVNATSGKRSVGPGPAQSYRPVVLPSRHPVIPSSRHHWHDMSRCYRHGVIVPAVPLVPLVIVPFVSFVTQHMFFSSLSFCLATVTHRTCQKDPIRRHARYRNACAEPRAGSESGERRGRGASGCQRCKPDPMCRFPIPDRV